MRAQRLVAACRASELRRLAFAVPTVAAAGNAETPHKQVTFAVTAAIMQTVYRFYNLRAGTHFYTASEAEKNAVLAKWPIIFRLEGSAFFIAD